MNNKGLVVAICFFIIVCVLSLLLVLDKGYVFGKRIFSTAPAEKTEEKVEEKIQPKLEFEIQKEYISVKDKETSELISRIDGEEITEGIEYTSSDERIAKIVTDKETGLPVVQAVSYGNVKVRAVYDGQEAEAEIRCIIPIKSMSFTSTNSVVRVGKDLQMKLKTTPSDATIDTLEYTSSDESIATVNSNGIVTGVSAGKVKMTVTDTYTGTEKSVSLTIQK